MKKCLSLTLIVVFVFTLVSCKHKHNFSEWKTVTEATCVGEGAKKRVCQCGYTETEKIALSDHNYVNGICENCDAYTLEPTSEEYFTFTENDDGTYSVAAKEVELPTTIIIPSSYNGKPVTTIAEETFGLVKVIEGPIYHYSPRKVETVIIPDSVTTISKKAFYMCAYLNRVIIGDSVTHIEEQAFSNCNALKRINSPKSLVAIGDQSFYATNIAKVVFPESLISIGKEAFGNSGIVTVTIPKSVTEIGEDAFYYCESFCEVVNRSLIELSNLPESVLIVHSGDSKIVEVDGYLFYKHEGKYLLVKYSGDETELILPESVNGEKYDIRSFGLARLSTVTTIVIPEGVKEMGSTVFLNCYTFVNVYLPRSLATVNSETFIQLSYGNLFYAGSEEEASAILIKQDDETDGELAFEDLSKATIYYNTSYSK